MSRVQPIDKAHDKGVTNRDFLETIFGDEWGKVHVTAFPDDPNNIEQARRGICWAGGPASRKLSRMGEEENQYYTISLFHFDEAQGKERRARDLFDATFVIVADDVKEKLPLEQVEKLPLPTFKLYSSAHSEQWGWVLEEPCEDRDKVDNLLDGLVRQGLAPDGKDPGMKGVTRYVRLPEGSNTKANRWVDGEPFKCFISEWEPGRMYSIESLAEVFDIDLEAERGTYDPAIADAESPIVKNHPIRKYTTATGYGAEGWTRIDCPNADKHSTSDASGGAYRIASDGHVEYQCHHGACNGDSALSKKVTGPKVLKLLGDQNGVDLVAECDEYMRQLKVEGAKLLMEKSIAGHSSEVVVGEEEGEDRTGEWGYDMGDYIYMAPRNEFYSLRSGAFLSPAGLNNLYLSECTGKKGSPLASNEFLSAMDKAMSSADGVGWMPTGAGAPTREEVIFENQGQRLVNTWKGFALTPVDGDVSLWLDHAEYLFPDAGEREVVIKYLAAVLQRLDEKPAFSLVNRGSHRVGKDTFFEPIVRAFGHCGSGTVNIDDLVAGWGDYLAQKKFMIINEIDKGQNKKMSNALKTFIAPTASGVRTLNLKGRGVVTQADVTAYVMMTNHHHCLTIEKGDKRYFVADSWIEPQSAGYYRELRNWLENEGGFAKVMGYLLSLDISDFSLRSLPYMTEGAKSLVQSGKYDYEQDMEEMVNNGEHPFNIPFTMKELKAVLKAQGHTKVGNNGIATALIHLGFGRFRGQKMVEGVSTKTPTFYSRELPAEATPAEIYDFYSKFNGAIGEQIKKLE